MRLYHEEMAKAFPEARVVLTVPDPDRWFYSFPGMSSSAQSFCAATTYCSAISSTIP